jgi:hypothetical protein
MHNQLISIQDLADDLESDPQLAWGWLCNLSMMAQDAGADRIAANQQAALFIKRMFDIDIELLCPTEWASLGVTSIHDSITTNPFDPGESYSGSLHAFSI